MQKGLQRIKRILFIILALAAAFVMPACEEEAGEVPETVAVSVADSIFFTSSVPPALVPLGGDYTFTLNMLHSCEFVSCDYDDYSVRMIRPGVFELTLHNVVAPARVSVTAQLAERESEHTELDCSITYELLGATYEGAGSRTVDYVVTQHLRPNTWNGQGLEREGFTLLGWNTEEDGSGEHIGLGSRVTVEDGGHITLYAEWVEWLPADDFLYRENADGTAALTGYRGPGDDELFVMPAQLDGHEITSVANSFTTNIPCGNITSPILVLPDTVISIASGAFMHSAFEEMYFFDTLEDISLTAFSNNIKTYHLNAALPPHYQALNNSSYYADSVDRLITTADKKRIIFFAGCSFTYGVNSPMVQAVVGDEYAVCNLGLNGDINGAFQMEILLNYIQQGDILVHTPEVMCGPQLMSSMYFDGRAMIMCEGNFDLLSIPDFSESDLFIRAYLHFVEIRAGEEECSYSDGRAEDFNIYGDFISPRPYDEATEHERDVSYSDNAYNYSADVITEEGMDKLCGYYDIAREKGAVVCVSYSPVNSSADTQPSVYEAGRQFDEKLRAMLGERGYSVISDYTDYIWPGRFFYDSDYHLNDLGAIYRTERLLADMRDAGLIDVEIQR